MNFGVDLPKWPQCIISGVDVTSQQALEIIRRTDQFFQSCFIDTGNDREFIRKVKRYLGIPVRDDNDQSLSESDFDKIDKWKKDWGVIETEYIENSWIACSWVGGYHGWCSPTGCIGYRNNVGKWPSEESIYSDLQKISEAFPFLDMKCTLMSKEECEFNLPESRPLVSFVVKNGDVTRCLEPIEKEDLLPLKGIEVNFDRGDKEGYFTFEDIKSIWKKI